MSDGCTFIRKEAKAKAKQNKLVQWSFKNIRGIFSMSSKFQRCSKHLSKRQTSHMRFVQDAGEVVNAPVTSPLTPE